MTIKSFSRGHPIEFNGINWIYSDNKKLIDTMRACLKCKQIPTKEGYDACIGFILGIKSACCGHGVLDNKILK